VLQVLLRFPLWDQWKPVLLLCSALDISKELINFLRLSLTYLPLSNHRDQPPTPVTNAFLYQSTQTYTAQSSFRFKSGGVREESYRW